MRRFPGILLAVLAAVLAAGLTLSGPAWAASVAPPPPAKPAAPEARPVPAATTPPASLGQTPTDTAVTIETTTADPVEAGDDLAMLPTTGAVPRPPGPKPVLPRPSEGELIAAAGVRPDQVGYLVYDLDTGEPLLQHNADSAAFLPASVMKLPTMVTALALLGPDHRFTTVVRFDGSRVGGGVWRGTLTLVGGGDPMLDSDDLRALVARLKAAGLRRLEGTFAHDDSYLPGRASLEGSQPPEHSYNPGMSALSLDFNRVRVRWSGRDAKLIETHGTPPVAPIRIVRDDNAAGWSRAGPALRHDFAPLGSRDANGPIVETWRLSPLAAQRGERWLPVKAPAPFTAAVFQALAAEDGIVLPDPQPATGPARGPIVASHQSPRLEAIAAAGLEYSNNLLAELVGMAATRALTGRPLALEESAAVMDDWLRHALPWVDWSGFVMANHSGLSPASRASPGQIVGLLRFAHDQGLALTRGGDFAALLPKRRFRDPGSDSVARTVRAGDVTPQAWAKSGTIYHGRGLAGLVQTRSGRRLVFSLFTADLAARKAFDDGYLHYSGRAVGQARAGLRRARDLEHALLLKWTLDP